MTSQQVPARVVMVLPSMRVSGGVIEALRLGEALAQRGAEVRVLSLWSAAQVAPTVLPRESLSSWVPRRAHAAVQFPRLLLRFVRWTRRADAAARDTPMHFVFTHFSTLALALCVQPRRRWWFVQDIEWLFPRRPWARWALERMIGFVARRSRLIAANDYLRTAMQSHGMNVEVDYPIWADPRFATAELASASQRAIDVLFILRSGHLKRPDLYFEVGRVLLRRDPTMRLVAVSPDQAWLDTAQREIPGVQTRFSPGQGELTELYRASRCFLLLSEHEGFGLPPLEAMGSGCVPVCRDAGGPTAYMRDELGALVLPRSANADAIADFVLDLLGAPQRWGRLSEAAREGFAVHAARHARRRDEAITRLMHAVTAA